MSHVNHSAYMPYGAYELKATYQRNLSLAMLITVLFIGLLLLAGWLLQGEPPVVRPISSDRIISVVSIPRPIDILCPELSAGNGGRPRPEIDSYSSIPNPVAEEDFDPSTSYGLIMSRDDRWGVVEDDGREPGEKGDYGQGVGGYAETDYIPDRDEFVGVEEPAELIHSVPPNYPRLAKEIGAEGRVVIQVLVSKTGEVLEAVVYVSSGHTLLDEAALAVARDYKYRPAIQNHRPVAVWVTYNVNFKLE